MTGRPRNTGWRLAIAAVLALCCSLPVAAAPYAQPAPATIATVAPAATAGRLAHHLPINATTLAAAPGLAAFAADPGKKPHGRSERLRELLATEPLASFGIGISIGEALSAVVAILLTLLLSSVLQRGLKHYGQRRSDVNQAALYTISRLLHYVLLLVGFLLALQLAGIPLSQFAVFTGAIGVGLGFGLQAMFSNFISGLILLFDRSLKVGDFVELEGDIRGVVRAINIRSTLITTNDNIDVLVPNSEFVSKRLVNWTHGSVHRRIRIKFSIGYDVDKELVKKAALEAAAQVPYTLAMDGRHKPQVWLVGFGESAVDYILAVWLTEDAARRNTAIRAAYLWELDTALRRHGIANSFPQSDLNIRSLFGLHGPEALTALRGVAGQSMAAPVAEPMPDRLDPRERDLLSRNDAKEETRIEIEEAADRDAEADASPATREQPG